MHELFQEERYFQLEVWPHFQSRKMKQWLAPLDSDLPLCSDAVDLFLQLNFSAEKEKIHCEGIFTKSILSD